MIKQELYIKKNTSWIALETFDRESVKYNAVVNRIGNPYSREIKHSNTLSLPYTSYNIAALELNRFNHTSLSNQLNKKWECKVLIDDDSILKGYLVINNTDGGQINVNYIDGALALIDLWKKDNLYNLFNTSELYSNLPITYQSVVDEMTSYNITSGDLARLSTISGKTYPLSLFPNTLNSIGDKFNKLDTDERVPPDRINPWQTRPLLNVKAFLDSICYAYGYMPIYEKEVDINDLSVSYIVSDKGKNNNEAKNSLLQFTSDTNASSNPYGTSFSTPPPTNYCYNVMEFVGIGPYFRPIDIPNWGKPADMYPDYSYRLRTCGYMPDVSKGYVGTINIHGNLAIVSPYGAALEPLNARVSVFAAYENVTPGGNVVFKTLTTDPDLSVYAEITSIDCEVDKAEMEIPPAGGGTFLGIFVDVKSKGGINAFDQQLLDSYIVETYINPAAEEIVYNENDEYFINTTVNLTSEFPKNSISTLLVGILSQQGLLCDIDEKNKEVVFFTYGTYSRKIAVGDFYDWSNHLVSERLAVYDTDFGLNYGKINRIGLKEPYRGNSYDRVLTTGGIESKLDSLVEYYSKEFKDISAVQSVNFLGSHPYFEYKNLGLGLVNSEYDINGLIPTRANGTEGSSNNYAHVQNINYLSLPRGIEEWYNLIDIGLRVKVQFTIPESTIKTLDIKKPVYVNDLLGFCIIEEVKEYINSTVPVDLYLLRAPSLSSRYYSYQTTAGFSILYDADTGKYYVNGTATANAVPGSVGDIDNSRIPRPPVDYYSLTNNIQIVASSGLVVYWSGSIGDVYDLVEMGPFHP